MFELDIDVEDNSMQILLEMQTWWWSQAIFLLVDAVT